MTTRMWLRRKRTSQKSRRKLAEINKASASATDADSEKGSAIEPIEIRQLRQQIHQDDEDIALANREIKRLQSAIGTVRVASVAQSGGGGTVQGLDAGLRECG